MNKIAVMLLAAVGGAGCWSDTARQNRATPEAKAVDFLRREVPAWSRENGCFSCHNNGDGARALYAASRKGHRVPASALADTTAWIKRPSRWEHNKGDPGFSDQRLANIQFSASLLAAYECGHVKDRDPLQDAARKVAAGQDADGAWHIERQNPVGSPATYGTTLATFMAWRTLVRAGVSETSGAIQKAEAWLINVRPNNVPNTAVLLMLAVRNEGQLDARSPTESLDFLRLAQTQDGGWGPYKDSPPEVFDTALVLLALAEARDQPGVAEMIQRGRTFLHTEQLPDGSWPATTRPSGGQSYAQQISTTGWATLALLQTSENVVTKR